MARKATPPTVEPAMIPDLSGVVRPCASVDVGVGVALSIVLIGDRVVL